MAHARTNESRRAVVHARDLGWKDFPVLVRNDPASLSAYVTIVYGHAVATAKDAIAWYLVNKVPQKRRARALRLAAIVFTVIGGLIPLIAASKVLTAWTADVEFSQFGYIALALAGACIGLDKYFGYSSAWIRYLTTAMMLQRLLDEFCLDWALLDASPEGRAAQITPMLRRIQAFVMRVRAELEKETADWAAEYRSNLAEMEKSVREQQNANRPGSISLTVTNVSKADPGGVTVLLDGVIVRKIVTPDCLLAPVFPREHVVTIRGTIANTLRSASAPARVDPGRPCLVTLKLPEDDAQRRATAVVGRKEDQRAIQVRRVPEPQPGGQAAGAKAGPAPAGGGPAGAV